MLVTTEENRSGEESGLYSSRVSDETFPAVFVCFRTFVAMFVVTNPNVSDEMSGHVSPLSTR